MKTVSEIRRGRKPQTIQQILDKYVGVERKEENCWVWNGPVQRYPDRVITTPVVRVGGKPQKAARRLIYEGLIEAVPRFVALKQSCITNGCVNPHHVFNPYAGFGRFYENSD